MTEVENLAEQTEERVEMISPINSMKMLSASIADIEKAIQKKDIVFDLSKGNQTREPEKETLFTIDLLPNWLKKTARDHSKSYSTPLELWTTAFLCGISAAAGKRIKLITGNYANYPQLWVMVVGKSGSGKSDAFRVAFKELLRLDNKSYAKYQQDYDDWEDTGEGRGTPPHWHQLLINDSTPEALFSALSMAENGLTLYRDELSGWFKDFGRYTRSGEIGHYLSIFDNQQITINRKQERPRLIADPLMNIFGTIQPQVLNDVLSSNNAESSGFAQRFLYLYPDFEKRSYMPDIATPESIKDYNNVINSIVQLDENAETTLSPDAEKEYVKFYNDMESKRNNADDFWAAVYSKAQIQVLRLALTIKIARLPEVPTDFVEVEDILSAGGMMRYFINSLIKFKNENKTSGMNKVDIIKAIVKISPNANQSEVGRLLNVSQQYVSKITKL